MRPWTVALLLSLVGCSGGTHTERASSRQLVYAVEDLTQGGHRTTTEVVDIDSPQVARTLMHEGSSATGASLGGAAWSARSEYLIAADGTVSVVRDVAPQFAGAAWNLGVAVEFAVAHGRATPLGNSSVSGRACSLVRTLEPVDAGELAPARGTDHAESCVAADGTLLQDAWTLKGELVRRRTLVSDGSGPSRDLLSGRAPKPAPTSSVMDQVKDVTVPVLVKALGIPTPSAPLGLPVAGTAATISLDPAGAGVSVEGGVLSWTDGRRLVVLQVQRGLLAPLSVGSAGVPVALGPRTVRVQALAIGLRVRFAGPDGLVATATANVPASDLLTWVASVRLSKT